jgi:glycogen debranching enzyme
MNKESLRSIDKCYLLAADVISKSSTKHGLYASAGIDGYNAVWARDSMVSMIGACFVDDKSLTTSKQKATKKQPFTYKKKFKEVFRQSIITLSKHQSKHGQIPNAVDKWAKDRKPHVDFASIDSSLWYIIGHFTYKKRYKDNSLFKQYKKNIYAALSWLESQDSGEDGTLLQLPTTDWQDAFPHKYGRTINTQTLYFKVLELLKGKNAALKLRKIIDDHKDRALWNGKFYSAWRWKNHGKYVERGDWFDSLGNLLAIVFGLADTSKSKIIISYLEKNKIHLPFGVKSIYPPIRKNSKEWQDYFNDNDAKEANHYLNGGIWPYIGGFYVLSLIKLKKYKQATLALENLANANLKGNFPEWINPITQESFGNLQSWDAGMYIIAYESLKKKKVLI